MIIIRKASDVERCKLKLMNKQHRGRPLAKRMCDLPVFVHYFLPQTVRQLLLLITNNIFKKMVVLIQGVLRRVQSSFTSLKIEIDSAISGGAGIALKLRKKCTPLLMV